MFCSTIIPTVGRVSLSRAVNSVLEQSFEQDNFEVIVVNDSGHSLKGAGWRVSSRVSVIDTNQVERSAARNTGAAIAKGRYLHFLDDDDWLLPGALKAFWSIDQVSDAAWLHGSYQTVDNEGSFVAEYHPKLSGNVFALLVAGESIPFQASLLDAEEFHKICGFDADPRIIGIEDRDVGRRLALHGNIAHTTTFVAAIRIGEVGSTTNWDKIAEGDRLGREKALRSDGAFARLRSSANSNYLRGRVSRAYFASAAWNFRHLNIFVTTSRLVSGIGFTFP